METKDRIMSAERIPMPEHAASSIAAVRKSVTVPATPDRAFALFTAGFGDWWPLATHSVGTDKAAAVALAKKLAMILFMMTPQKSHGPRWVPRFCRRALNGR